MLPRLNLFRYKTGAPMTHVVRYASSLPLRTAQAVLRDRPKNTASNVGLKRRPIQRTPTEFPPDVPVDQLGFNSTVEDFTSAIPSPTVGSTTANAVPTTFYRRPLPEHLISFTSIEGKRIFADSLQQKSAENYFPLVGNFTTQSEPAYCGPGSLAMVLNALEMDPGRQWKGVWRWYSDQNLECFTTGPTTLHTGVTFREFACLARCNGLKVISKRADRTTKEEFMNDLKTVCSRSDIHMVVNFHRGTLKQTGDGHFSPIGLMNEKENVALILDTARFKYPSYYVDIDLLYESLKPIDKETGLPRGYFLLSRVDQGQHHLQGHMPSLCKLTQTFGVSNPKLAKLFCHRLPLQIAQQQPNSLQHVVGLVLKAVPEDYSVLVSLNDLNAMADLTSPDGQPDLSTRKQHLSDLNLLLTEVRRNPLFTIVDEVQRSHVPHDSHNNLNTALATIFILSSPREIYRTLPANLSRQLDQYRDLNRMSDLMRSEVSRISDQLSSLMNDHCQCRNRQAALAQLPSVKIQQLHNQL